MFQSSVEIYLDRLLNLRLNGVRFEVFSFLRPVAVAELTKTLARG